MTDKIEAEMSAQVVPEPLTETEQMRENVEEIDYNTNEEYASGYVQGEDIEMDNSVPECPQDPSDEVPRAQEMTKEEHVEKPKEREPLKSGLMRLSAFVLRQIVSAMSTLVDEATFEVEPEGVSFRGMDPSHIALLDVHVPMNDFEAYDIDHKFKFGVRVDELLKILKQFKDNDRISITFTEDQSFAEFSSYDGLSYKIRLIESAASSTPLPKLNFNAMIRLTNAALSTILKNIAQSSEYVTIKTTNPKVIFNGRGDVGEVNLKVESGYEGLEYLSIKEDSTATYSLDYLRKIQKVMSLNEKGKGKNSLWPSTVTLQYSSKMPVRLSYKVGNVGKADFYLAPRVQD